MAAPRFSDVPAGPPDPMFTLKQASDNDTTPEKIDVGIGVYRGTTPGYYEFKAITKAKKHLEKKNLGHEYLPTTGIQTFIDGATRLLFGRESTLTQEKRVASVQTVGGTGAVRLGAAFLNRNIPDHSQTRALINDTKIFVGTPAWPNYVPLFKHAGFEVETFNHYNRSEGSVNIKAALGAIMAAPSGSIFTFQVCCHNPTGQDYSQDQWKELAEAVKTRNHFIFFDIAYQGFATNMEADAWPVRYFAAEGVDLLACQSFSKHMGLYSERVGVLHVVCKSSDIAVNVKDQLRSLIRWEVSSTPAYGGRLANIIMQDDQLFTEWTEEVQGACDRMIWVRQTLHHLLVDQLQTPGSWDHILVERGLFSYMNLSKQHIERLRLDHHIYLAESGRINIAGLNQTNVDRFAQALDVVVGRESADKSPRIVEARL